MSDDLTPLESWSRHTGRTIANVAHAAPVVVSSTSNPPCVKCGKPACYAECGGGNWNSQPIRTWYCAECHPHDFFGTKRLAALEADLARTTRERDWLIALARKAGAELDVSVTALMSVGAPVSVCMRFEAIAALLAAAGEQNGEGEGSGQA